MRKNRPEYPQNTDYNTNELSYYEYLARINELIKELADRIWDYEKVLAENIEEIERTLKEVVDKIGEGFNQEIHDLLVKWVEDGTLDHIINETLMNKKADKVDLEALEELVERELNKLVQSIENVEDLLLNKAPYENIKYRVFKDRDIETTCYLTEIKRDTKDGKRLNLNYQKLTGLNTEVPSFARKVKASVAINAGMFGSNNNVMDYPNIENGEPTFVNHKGRDYRFYLAIMPNGRLRSYSTFLDINQLVNDGVKHATVGFVPMFENGRRQSEAMTSYEAFSDRHPRQIIGQVENGDYFILTIGGRGVDGHGATLSEAYNIAMREVKNITFLYNLDGGGSTQTVIKGQMINPSYSGRGAVVGAEIRKRPDVIYIEEKEKVSNRDEQIDELAHSVALMQDKLSFISGVQYGKWTPALGSVANYIEESVQYSTQSGDYIRIGNLIIAFYHLVVTDKGTGSGIIRMRGLPGANNTSDYLTSDVTVMDGFRSPSVFNPFFEQRGAGTLQLKAMRTDGDDYVAGEQRTNEIVLGNYESMKDQFTMIGRHIFIVDGNFEDNF